MAVIGQSHFISRSRVADYISHGNTIVRIVPIEVGLKIANTLLELKHSTSEAVYIQKGNVNYVYLEKQLRDMFFVSISLLKVYFFYPNN